MIIVAEGVALVAVNGVVTAAIVEVDVSFLVVDTSTEVLIDIGREVVATA